jgi:predicted nucleotide-binding protein
MARKKASPPPPQVPLELTTAREGAEERIKERVSKGAEIIEVQINDPQALVAAEKEYGKWNSFNLELLKRLFTSDELCMEYNLYTGGMSVMMRAKHLGEKVSDFYKKVEDKNHRLQSIIERLDLIPEPANVASGMEPSAKLSKEIDRSKIFIVHGHDDSAKLEVARFIEKIGLEPIILHEQASGSRTIIEKIETYSDVGFGVVIYSPCDIGGKNTDFPDLAGRARQNVVFEHGFLIGKLGRSKVCPLVTGSVETPNDISGIVYTSMDSSNWQIELAKELRAAEYPVDMNNVI